MTTIKDKQTVYKLTFGNENGREVLSDLNEFCFGTKTTANREEDILILEGRRQVFLQIMTMLKIDLLETVFEEYVENEF